MRKITRAAMALLTLVSLVGLGGATASAIPGGQGNEDNVTFCHRTNSNTNPYVIITTDPSGENGGTDHLGEHVGPLWNDQLKKAKTEWGDVIPPPADDPLAPGSPAYEFLEGLDEGAGQDFIDDGCAFVPDQQAATHDVTLDKVTTGGTAPAADTEFTFSVLCELGEEGGDVPVTVTIAPEDDPVVVAEGVAEDDSCTITETGTNDADSVSFTVNGGAPVAGDSVTFTVGESNVAVVATNAYPEPTVVVQPPPETEVLGEVITKAPAVAALPKTGSMTLYYAIAGAALLLLGSLAQTASRRLAIRSQG